MIGSVASSSSSRTPASDAEADAERACTSLTSPKTSCASSSIAPSSSSSPRALRSSASSLSLRASSLSRACSSRSRRLRALGSSRRLSGEGASAVRIEVVSEATNESKAAAGRASNGFEWACAAVEVAVEGRGAEAAARAWACARAVVVVVVGVRVRAYGTAERGWKRAGRSDDGVRSGVVARSEGPSSGGWVGRALLGVGRGVP